MRIPVFRWYLAAFFTFWGTVAALDSITCLVGDKGPGGGSTVFEPCSAGSALSRANRRRLLARNCRREDSHPIQVGCWGTALTVRRHAFRGAEFRGLVIVTFWFVIDVMQWDSL